MRSRGHVVVLEGPDGVGKSSLQRELADRLSAEGVPVTPLAFPGNAPSSLGELVYRLHHGMLSVSVEAVSALALQTLHVAAHIDAVERTILPVLQAGRVVLLDRSWWSTWAYGVVQGIDRPQMDALMALEGAVWGEVRPSLTILLKRAAPVGRENDPARHRALTEAYEQLAASADHEVLRLVNEAAFETALNAAMHAVRRAIQETNDS